MQWWQALQLNGLCSERSLFEQAAGRTSHFAFGSGAGFRGSISGRIAAS
jgi:hypothetical protein